MKQQVHQDVEDEVEVHPRERNLKIDSIVDSLTGIISNEGMSLEDYRLERLDNLEKR